jgi:hypothetical protein
MSDPLPHYRKFTIKVQTWSVTEVTVEVEASTERHARELALSRKHEAVRGHITKNKTTILKAEPAK